MTATNRVRVNSTLPIASSEWETALGDDPALALKYTNLAFDLVGYAMAELGIAMSEAVLGDDSKMQAIESRLIR